MCVVNQTVRHEKSLPDGACQMQSLFYRYWECLRFEIYYHYITVIARIPTLQILIHKTLYKEQVTKQMLQSKS